MRVLLIDDHALFRIGLRELLERRGIEVAAAEGNGHDGIVAVIREKPDVILLDMRLPDISGLEVLKEFQKHKVTAYIVILTTSRKEKDLIESLQNGAQGYLLKDMEPDELIVALEDIVKGTTVVARELTGILARAVRGESAQDDTENKRDIFKDLTPREREILCLLAEGQSNKVVAKNLGISDGTVKLHVKAILRKLNVHSRVEAAVMAVERNVCNREQTG